MFLLNLKIKDIIELIAKNGMMIKEESIKVNESGLDFQVLHAKDKQNVKWIIRIPRRKDVMEKVLLEKKVLDIINQSVSFEVPIWSVYTDEVIAYKQLAGVPTGTYYPATQEFVWEFDERNVPESYHHSLGKVLAELHRVPKETLSLEGLTVQTAEESKSSMIKRMHAVKETFGVGEYLWARWQAWIANEEIWPKETGLIHGDIQPGHTLMNSHQEVTGLIDWTEVAVTDVSKDFISHYMVFGEKDLEYLLSSYQKSGGITWPFMKEHIVEMATTFAIDIAEFAGRSGSEEYVKIAKNALEVTE